MERSMRLILTLALALAAFSAKGATFETAQKAKAFSDEIMNLFIQEKFGEGLGRAKEYWPLPAVEIDSLANTIDQQWTIVRKRFGKATGMEYIKTERIGESFIRHIYLHKFANHAIYWHIDYYKPTEKWSINAITFLDRLDELYE